uniref:CXCL-F2a n=1 Tax=Monopterus albus TaxID=43700 RepID=A0A4D6FSP6_MONAL|nr:C-X-C motif chemokine 10-like [Monopterus albus]XP_020478205.1 C-X-C motif chemokine 10-like [Monopterus albus]QCB64396.1 CXCL-F2a [Monopterus albus]QCB64397.1 CXCL-F2a [Monopterus albus]
MSSMIKVFLLLAVMVCISKAHANESENQCLCQRVRANLIGKSPVKDIQIYPATIFCDRVEIVVTTSNNFRYCLNPSLDKVKRLLNKIIKKVNTTTTAIPHNLTTSTNTARA